MHGGAVHVIFLVVGVILLLGSKATKEELILSWGMKGIGIENEVHKYDVLGGGGVVSIIPTIPR